MPQRKTDPELGAKVLEHLKAYPVGLTPHEIARALRLDHPSGYGADRVRSELVRLDVRGLVRVVTGPKEEHDRRLCSRWWPA
jgi:hypothetical protein